jgi:hypothetical protein
VLSARMSVEQRIQEVDGVLIRVNRTLDKAKSMEDPKILEPQRKMLSDELRAELRALKKEVYLLYPQRYMAKDPWTRIPFEDDGFAKFVQQKDQRDNLLTFVEYLKTTEQDKLNDLADLRDELPKAIEALEKRNVAIVEKLSNDASQAWVTKFLPLYIGLVGILSLLILWMVRYFTPELQMELVATGQVVQFLTVTVLLISIMALGLGGILKEQIIGTLLGGVGGYILSQGVGLANRSRNDRTTPGSRAPTITGVAPNTGPHGGGTPVTITGTNFTGTTGVLFGATQAPGFVVNSDTSITVPSPPVPVAMTVHIQVNNQHGTSQIGAADQFTYS